MAIDLLPDNPPTPPVSDNPFAALVDALPETANEFLGVEPKPTTEKTPLFDDAATPDPAELRKKRVKMSKKMQKMMDGLRDQVVDIPVLWFHQQAMISEHPEWELDAKEREFLGDAVGVVFEVLDIEIAIQPIAAKLESVWWVIAYPFVAFLFLFLTKKDKVNTKDKEHEVQP